MKKILFLLGVANVLIASYGEVRTEIEHLTEQRVNMIKEYASHKASDQVFVAQVRSYFDQRKNVVFSRACGEQMIAFIDEGRPHLAIEQACYQGFVHNNRDLAILEKKIKCLQESYEEGVDYRHRVSDKLTKV